jgi:hypothetical protein
VALLGRTTASELLRMVTLNTEIPARQRANFGSIVTKSRCCTGTSPLPEQRQVTGRTVLKML